MEEITDLKKSIRTEAMGRRDSIPAEVRKAKDSAIRERLFALEEFCDARSVLLYASFRSEAKTTDIIEGALAAGKKVLLPKVDSKNGTLTKHPIESLRDVSPGYMGIPEPGTDEKWRVEDIELIVVPGVAFDARGRRVGYGGGYYDRLLPRVKGRRPIVALAYEEQMFDDIPGFGHDVDMDIIITDRRTMDCRGQG